MELLPSVAEAMKEEWCRAENGSKARVVKKWAKALGCSYQTVYRMLGVGRRRKKGQCKIAGIKEAASLVAQIKKRPPEHAGEISTDQAVRAALQNGLISEEMARVSPATFNRVIREAELNRRAVRIHRFQALYPNQLHHIDASSSQYFYVHKELPDGDCVLRMHGSSPMGYKNKPVPNRLRPWIYGLTDDYSGYHVARYVAAQGECLADNVDFLQWAWARNDKPFFGLPERIKADLGPLLRGKAATDWLDRLGIDIDPSVPHQKEAHGKIERPWRTHWQRFELTYFIEADWKHFEISMSELCRQFENYLVEYNNRPHRYEKNVSRLDMWRRISLRGGAVEISEDALKSVVKRYERTVDRAGCLSLDGVLYEVRGLHCAKVKVYEGVFEDRLVVEDIRTGEKYGTRRFCPLPLDTYKAAPATPHQVAVKAAADLQLRNTLYAGKDERRAEDGNSKVTRLPTRIKEHRKIQNPLDTDSFSSIDQAIREFMGICMVRLDAESRDAIRALIIENGLSRTYVRELALEIQAESNQTEVG
ncbi:MAG: hypothetical protein AAGU11_16760 [Syntrophobacteraceae bacterium]